MFEAQGRIFSSSAADGGTVYLCTTALVAVNVGGIARWMFAAGGGLIYAGCNDSRLGAILRVG